MSDNVKFRQIKIKDETINYVEFGSGVRPMVILPGLEDGIAPVNSQRQADLIASFYNRFSKEFKVYVFSRGNNPDKNRTTRSMAENLAQAMKGLDISKASVVGITMGGMIAQYLAIDYPELVDKLVFADTRAKQSNEVQEITKR